MIKRFQQREDLNQISISKRRYIPTREFYSHVIDSIEDYAVFTMDLDLKINSWNSGASKIFKYTEGEIIGQKFHFIFTQHDRTLGIPEKEIRLALDKGKAKDNRWHLC